MFAQLSKKIQYFHLQKRLALPPTAKDYVGLFLEIKTMKQGVPQQSTILFGTLQEHQDFGSALIRFQHKTRPSVLFWSGENGYSSTTNIYLVDKGRVDKEKKVMLTQPAYIVSVKGFS